MNSIRVTHVRIRAEARPNGRAVSPLSSARQTMLDGPLFCEGRRKQPTARAMGHSDDPL